MMIFGRKIALEVIGMAVLALLLILAIGFGVRSCEKRRSEAAQARMERSQAQAQTDSAKDAINAVAASGEAERASEDMTRNNSAEIHAAPGANDRVNSGVDLAGRKALCRRAAYRDDPKCKVLR